MRNIRKPDKALALTCGTLTCWLGVLVIDIISHAVMLRSKTGMALDDYVLGFLLPGYVIIGIPIAFVLCLTLGSVIWAVFEKYAHVKMRHALFAGALLGALLGGTTFHLTKGSLDIFPALIDFLSTIFIGTVSGFVTHRVAYQKIRDVS